jgi:Cytochrome P460
MRALSIIALAIGLSSLSAVVAAQLSDEPGSPIYGVKLPVGYRDWRVITVAHEAGKNNDIRAIVGNDIAVKAFREGTRPFPDGTIIARLAWQYDSSPRNDAVFPGPQSFVAGTPTNVQISVKDSRRYSSSGGWGYGQFENGKPNTNAALVQTCSACHSKLDDKAGFVFSGYSP